MPNKIDLVGQVFGRLTVEMDGQHKAGRRQVVCLCECGTRKQYDPRELRGGQISCGCYQKQVVAAICGARRTHGSSRTAEYNIWNKMKSRCSNPDDAKYPDYGGRGVVVCAAWADDFETFLADMGMRPTAAHSIDRKDVNGNYEPNNCRWATPKEQSRNKRNHRLVIYQGAEMPLSQACEMSGVNYRSALYRVQRQQHWMPLPAPPAALPAGAGEKP